MKKYLIRNCGCDDTTEFFIELNEEQLNFVIKLFEENNKVADYCCKPSLEIYEYNNEEDEYFYFEKDTLNKSYKELTGYFDEE